MTENPSSVIPDGYDEYNYNRPVMVELLGGDALARRAVNALWNGGIRTPQELYAAKHEDIVATRNVGKNALERIVRIRAEFVRDDAAYVHGLILDYGRICQYFESLIGVTRSTDDLSEAERMYVSHVLAAIADRHRLSLLSQENTR